MAESKKTLKKKKENEQKKSVEDIQEIRPKALRQFILIHTQGEEQIYAKTRILARIQAEAILKQKGLSWKRDKRDFFEVRL